jgi:predicted alpha/beta-hydrolase family hydrolase
VEISDIETGSGPAQVVLDGPGAQGLVLLGHGAGGSVEAPDLRAVSAALAGAGWAVGRVVQPYRVAGRRAPASAAQLDAAWAEVAARLRLAYAGPLVVGGRSSGARVACRTAPAVGAVAVVCLAFPLQPPRRPPRPPALSRAAELAVPSVPVLVVQGERDPFGAPSDFPSGPDVVGVPGDHSLRRTDPVAAAVLDWLGRQRLTGPVSSARRP